MDKNKDTRRKGREGVPGRAWKWERGGRLGGREKGRELDRKVFKIQLPCYPGKGFQEGVLSYE
jgi:hypothetical protein